MADCLLVPMYVEALLLSQDKAVTEALEDFTRLPYCNGQRDINPHIGYISDEIVSQPFQNQNLYLRAGIHLHWFLPVALTTEKNSTFPRVPDRWLITRSGGSKEPKQWIVESDYLHPEGEGEESIAFPLHFTETDTPYRRLGRKMSLGDWSKPTSSESMYLNRLNGWGLTAVGYGIPTFAAFYPNCYSVFGFYDEDFKDSFPKDLKYSVIGWYNNLADDFLKKYLDQPDVKGKPNIAEVLGKDLGWHLPRDKNAPQRMFCYGAVSKPIPDFKAGAKKVAVGNSGVEALSAYLADEVAGGQGDQKVLIEEQLEFLSIQAKLLNDHLDRDAKFRESQHERAFNAVYGGSQWNIQLNLPPGGASQSRQETRVKLPVEIAGLLSELNQKQREFDRAQQDITDMRRQLFSDWYKYMLCVYPPEGAGDAYPDIDHVRHFIETQDLEPLAKKVAELKTFKEGDLDRKLNELNQAIARHNKQVGADPYILKPIAASRYWQPKEPVVLIAGEAEAVFLENRIADLDCPVVDGPDSNQPVTKAALETLVKNVKAQEGSQQPWPLFLEWEVEFFPLSEGGNVFPTRDYQQDFITKNFALAENEVELQKEPDKSTVPSAQIYSGYSILTPQAGIQLKQNLAKYLQIPLKDFFSKEDIEKWYQNKPEHKLDATDDEVFQEWLNENINEICKRYESPPKINDEKTVQSSQPDPMATFLNAFKVMQGEVPLSQALSGFNDALLMHKQTLQLPIDDPLGFTEYQDFAARVKDAIAGENKTAPQPLDEFNPIRAGRMKILHLRLVDTFGRVKELPCDEVITSTQMHDPQEKENYMWLPPRLVQPARLKFRWLAANPTAENKKNPAKPEEMNAHPATHPICGWLLPNLLDNSLMAYDQSGIALGSLTANANWLPAPGSKTQAVDKIANPHLRKVIQYISTAGSVSDFISVLEDTLENIAPSHADGDIGLALLMGRPIAVVRASLKLELLGRPAIHQGWNVFRQDLRRETRDSDAFDAVRFPVRLGEQKQLNDGLIRYWLEDENGEISKSEPNAPLDLSLNEPLRTLTMLLDPHGKVHATSGVLPVKAIDIPPEQYSDVLRHFAVTFLAAPILTNKDQINLSLPAEPGYRWSWLEGQTSVASEKPINPPNSQEAFAAPQEIREGWLKLIPEENPPEASR